MSPLDDHGIRERIIPAAENRLDESPPIPALARSIDDCAAMKRDNVSRGDFWAITDGYYVTLAAQKVGEPATGMAAIPRDVFLRFVRWYFTGDADMRRGVSDDVVVAISRAIAKAEGR